MSQIKTYRTSRRKGAIAVAGCAVFAYAGTFVLSERPLLGWAVVLFFGVVAFAGLLGLLTGGSSLRLGSKGFEISSRFKRTRIRWDEIEPLQIAKIKKSSVIAVKYLPSSEKSGISRFMTGMDLTIGDVYADISLQDLCDAMNEWRSRYLDAGQARQTSSRQASKRRRLRPPSSLSKANPSRPGLSSLRSARPSWFSS